MKREEAIKDLDIIRFNPHWDELVNEEYWKELMEMAITALQNQPVWIPVSERLPEDYVPVNITWVNHNPDPYYASIKDVPFTATGICYKGKWYWYSVVCEDYLKEYGYYEPDVVDDEIEITAWMPLPEPYRESEPHKQTNADRIRSMTDEELAEFIARNNYDCANYCEDAKCGCSWSCGNKDKTIALQWLQKESEE